MLTTVWLKEQRNKTEECVLILGGFDGLHRGHEKLVSRAKTYGLPVGIMTILGGKEGQSLFTLEERKLLFQEAGIDFMFTLHFEEIKDLSAEAFALLLLENFYVKAFVCGDDFRFGKHAAGNAETLKQATQVRVEVESLLKVNGKKVSTSQIKELLFAGKIEAANTLLAQEFFLLGTVVKDRQIGRTIGFPTANICYPQDKFSLKKGVYETQVTLQGKTYRGITNYGARPTFHEESVVTETYLDDFAGDLYGQELCVRFLRFLRSIERFESAEALKEQLKTDVRRVREND